MKKKYRVAIAFLSGINQFFNYSFFTLAAVVLSNEFLGFENNKLNLLYYYKIMAISVIAKPLGSFIFGILGDKFGGYYAMLISGILTSLSLFFIGILPSYQQIGIFSTIFVLILRIIYSISFSGEVDTTRIYISDLVSKKRQYLANSIITSSNQIGVLISSILVYLLYLNIIGWRYCFIFGAIFALIIFILRRKDAEYSNSIIDTDNIFSLSKGQIFLGNIKYLIKYSILFGFSGALYNFYIIFFPSYLKLYFPDIFQKDIVIKFVLLYIFSAIFFGYIADKISGNFVVKFSAFFSLLCSILLFLVIRYGYYDFIIFNIYMSIFFVAGFSISIQILVKESLNKIVKYTVFGMSHSIGSAVFSSITPYISLKFTKFFGKAEYSCLYLILLSIISLIILRFINFKNEVA